MEKHFARRDVDNRISFRASPRTLNVLTAYGDKFGISPSVAARRILDETAAIGPFQETLDLMVDRILVLDELVRLMLSDVESERIGEAEHYARLRAIAATGRG
ncbi:MAG: hypothetical protein AAFW60_05830 [Pseudomonadota bacterium]